MKPKKVGKIEKEGEKTYLVAPDGSRHNAKETTVVLWKMCNGKRRVEDIGKEFPKKAGIPLAAGSKLQDIVDRAIEQLSDMDLIKK